MSHLKRDARSPAKVMEDGNIHFRLCHVCMALNESNAEIEECQNCQHVFKDEVLMQFWDDNDQEAFSDTLEEEHVEEVGDETEAGEDGEVQGLSVRF